jgi:hypothetical protein
MRHDRKTPNCLTNPDRHPRDYKRIQPISRSRSQHLQEPFQRATSEDTRPGTTLDLCDVFGSYSPGAKTKLDEICKIIGLPGKPSGIDGSEVETMVRAGRIAEVVQYCESDVLNTYRLWLVYELFRGGITAEQLAFSEAQAAEFVRSRKSDNPHLAESVVPFGPIENIISIVTGRIHRLFDFALG